MAGAAKRTTDHDVIRRWVEERGGCPARVKGTGGDDDAGLLRIDFPGYSGQQSLEPISWEDFFEKFEESGLAFLYQESEGESRFSKLVHRSGDEEEGAEAAAESAEPAASVEVSAEEERRGEVSDGSERGEQRAAGTRVADVMTPDPESIAVDASLYEAARRMAELDAGALPVVEREGEDVAIGVITDRDIVTRALAQEEDIADLTVGDVMTAPAVTVGEDDDVEDAVRIFEQAQVRRAVVVDDEGRCCGMLAQADLAFAVDDALAAELLRAISESNEEAARLPE